MESNSITKYYHGQEIFITGATGLIGKALVEKFLRVYPNVNKIFILLREKRGKSIDERLEEFRKSEIFGLIHQKNPEAMKKVIAVRGDIAEIGLGLSEEHLELIQNVSLIYHVAATVRFDEPIKMAILQNVRGTREALEIAEKLKNLKKFVHVSTAYSNPYAPFVKEEIYPPFDDWKAMIKIAEKYDSNTLNALTEKLIINFPNTYTFSKHLSEQVVNSYRYRVPSVVHRPAIVGNSFAEPYPGWHDALIGAIGILAIAGTGLARVIYCKSDNLLDVVPLDAVIMYLIVIPWKESNLPPLGLNDKVRVYNNCATNFRQKGCVPNIPSKMFPLAAQCYEVKPMKKCVWRPRLTCIENKYYFMLNIYLFHLIPALFLDGIIKLTGNRPVILHIQRRYLATSKVLGFFLHNSYYFETTQSQKILDAIIEYTDFPIEEIIATPTEHVMEICLDGIRKYILKETDKDLQQAKKQLQVFKFLDITVRLTFYYWCLKFAYNFLLENWTTIEEYFTQN